jgi:hypothetical protein
MQFNNRKFGSAAEPFRQSPYTQYIEFPGDPIPPPTACLLGIAVTSGVLALQVGGFLAVHCQSENLKLVDYNNNRYADYLGNTYIEVQPE